MTKIPYVLEGTGEKERSYDLYSRMMKDRIIFITGEFTRELADVVVAQLLFLESQDSEKDIYLYINSPGGRLTSMLAIYDTMTYIKPDIVTIGYGEVASAGSFILAAGTQGKRYALKNTDIMIHELSGGAVGKYAEIENSYKKITRLHKKMAKYYSQFTGKKLNVIKEDMKKDYFMTAEEARKYGLIDYVEEKRA